MPPTIHKLRNSERTAFKRCPQRWWWAYRQGLRPKGQPSNPLWFGTGIHLCFAEWYIPGQVRGRDMHETWEEYVAGEIRFIKTQAREDDGTEARIAEYVEAETLGHAMLDGYLEQYGLDENWDVIAPEQIFAVMIPDSFGDPIVELVGTFDGVYRDLVDDEIKLMEHKTAAQISTAHLSLDDQAGTYWAVATHVLRENKLIKPREEISSITYNFLRKAKPDERPVGPDGFAHNKPTKAHYLDAFEKSRKLKYLEHYNQKTGLPQLELLAKQFGVEVWGDVSKVQPAKNFVRHPVPRTRHERKTQIQRIADEALHMEAIRNGDLPLYKTPTKDCSWDCDFFAMCELHESTPDWTEYRDAMYVVKDPYADHRKAA
jgi:hypothetical protein